jgi:hypothetical protein
LEFVSSSLEKLIPSSSMKSQIREVFKDFKLLLDYVKSLGVNHEIIFVPLLVSVLFLFSTNNLYIYFFNIFCLYFPLDIIVIIIKME